MKIISQKFSYKKSFTIVDSILIFIQGGGGNTTTGQTGRVLFGNKELRERPVHALVEDPRDKALLCQLLQNVAVLLR